MCLLKNTKLGALVTKRSGVLRHSMGVLRFKSQAQKHKIFQFSALKLLVKVHKVIVYQEFEFELKLKIVLAIERVQQSIQHFRNNEYSSNAVREIDIYGNGSIHRRLQ